MHRFLLKDIIMAFSSSIDLISSNITNHHKRVAYIAYSISSELGFGRDDKLNVLVAGLLHDCGVIHDDEKIKTLQFDFGKTASERHEHGYKGWNLLRGIPSLKAAAEIIKFHHIYWDEPSSTYTDGHVIPWASYIIHIADRIDILVDRKAEILAQRPRITEAICNGSGKMFMPDAVDAFRKLASKEYFWFDLTSSYIEEDINEFMADFKTAVGMDVLLSIAQTLTKIIDSRSSFTAAHSAGVAECAALLASKMGFSENDVKLMYIAGLMHDLGKLAIPICILEKKGELDYNETNIMKKHTFYSYHILKKIPKLDKLNQWASFHHERIDGSGYPFKMSGNDLDLGSRIMAVSDVLTALTEDRPYRRKMSVKDAMAIIEDMVKNRHLDGDVTNVLKAEIEKINWMKLGTKYNKKKASPESYMTAGKSSLQE